jgi:hypothetical protein
VDFSLEPPGELKREQLAEQFADADAGVKITVPAGIVFFRFIISMNRTVEGEFHETRKRQNSALGGFAADDLKQRVHGLRLARR